MVDLIKFETNMEEDLKEEFKRALEEEFNVWCTWWIGELF
jgi:hypothetical protein